MRLVHLAAGAGGMYCGACARDAALVRGLIARGHEVTVIPLYTPLRTEGDAPLPTERVFLGGINAYLQQVSPLFRHTPDWFDRWLDSPGLLRWASRFAVSVKPEDLGPMTVSVLQGPEGRQRKELRKILDFIEAGPLPEVATITNSMLSGIAPALKERLGIPVACMLQGEESFIGAMREPYRTQAQDLLRRNAGSIDLFVSPGEAYGARMAECLGVPRGKVVTIRAGIDPAPYASAGRAPDEPFTIGYLSAINPSKGLDLLVEAWRTLVQQHGREARLLVAGKVMDEAFWRRVQGTVDDAGLLGSFEYLGEVDLRGKVDLFRRSSVFCVPSRIEESRGAAIMEAQAAGVPVVVPNSGVYPEMLGLTGGGLTHEPASVEGIAACLSRMMADPAGCAEMGRAGAEGIARHFGAYAMVEQTLEAYGRLVEAAR